MRFITLTLILFSYIIGVCGYSSGAPQSACSSLTPSEVLHGAKPHSISTFPYTVGITALSSGNFSITINSPDGSSIKGFMIKVTDSFGRHSGWFYVGTQVKGVCGPQTSPPVVTHVNSQEKRELTLTWLAGAGMTGSTQYYLRMTLVQSQRIYWTDYEVPFTGYDINAQTVRLVNSYPVTNWCQGQGRAGGRYAIVPFTRCKDYIQRFTELDQTYVRQCRGTSKFDYGACTCNYKTDTRCQI